MGAEHLEGPQNSDIRHVTNGSLLKVARWFHHTRLFRGVTPNNVTCFGALLKPFGALYSISVMNKDPEEITLRDRTKAALGSILPDVPDGFDGKLNTVLKEEEPEKVDPDGDLHDFAADRWGEGIGAIQRGVSAYLRGDLLGEIFAYSAGATNPLTSDYRIEAERRRKVVHEVKWWSLGALGNRFMRSGTSALGAAFPKHQWFIDAASTVSNLWSARDRRDVALYGSEVSLEGLEGKEREEKIAQVDYMQERAEKRSEISRRAIPLTTIAMIGTAVGLRVINHFIPIHKMR